MFSVILCCFNSVLYIKLERNRTRAAVLDRSVMTLSAFHKQLISAPLTSQLSDITAASLVWCFQGLTCVSDLTADVPEHRLRLRAVGHIQLQHVQILQRSRSQPLSSGSVHIQHSCEHLQACRTEPHGQRVPKARVAAWGRRHNNHVRGDSASFQLLVSDVRTGSSNQKQSFKRNWFSFQLLEHFHLPVGASYPEPCLCESRWTFRISPESSDYHTPNWVSLFSDTYISLLDHRQLVLIYRNWSRLLKRLKEDSGF